jgi:hypothetical protein
MSIEPIQARLQRVHTLVTQSTGARSDKISAIEPLPIADHPIPKIEWNIAIGMSNNYTSVGQEAEHKVRRTRRHEGNPA